MLKMTKKGNVKRIDEDGNVVARYKAVPFTSCNDCAIQHSGCIGASCTGSERADSGLSGIEVHFVLKAPKATVVAT